MAYLANLNQTLALTSVLDFLLAYDDEQSEWHTILFLIGCIALLAFTLFYTSSTSQVIPKALMAEHAHASESEPYTEALQKLSVDVQRIVETTAPSTSADSVPPSKASKAPQTIDPPMDMSMLYSASFMQKMASNAASNAHDVMQSISPNRVRRADEASSQSQLANPTYCYSSNSIDISNVDFVLPSTTASE